MKRIFLFTIITLSLSFGSVFAQSATTTKKDKKVTTEKYVKETAVKKTGKPIKGVVVGLIDALTGGGGELTKDKAADLVKKGEPLAVKSGMGKTAKIYIIANPDGSIANKELAEKAGKPVAVIGNLVTKNGCNVIIQQIIETMK